MHSVGVQILVLKSLFVSGRICENRIFSLVCDSEPCQNNGKCIQSASGNGYVCMCMDAYAGMQRGRHIGGST